MHCAVVTVLRHLRFTVIRSDHRLLVSDSVVAAGYCECCTLHPDFLSSFLPFSWPFVYPVLIAACWSYWSFC